ncbi:hypothetical protein Cni_G22904 [Canna indica]|uniref:Glycosyltransferase n=1 Tax=Canna indica TaxID=4628 RepID=A0AAQ3KSM5_9LILI|nr:hypothetical protein Cni_G22904 [Canna indica]
MEQQHFLLVSYAAQGHINPVVDLSRRLAHTFGARVTISVSISGHRRMFPSSADQEVDDGPISYIPYSDGYDDLSKRDGLDRSEYYERAESIGSNTLAAILRSLKEHGRPVTCVLYTLLLSWVCNVARDHGVPSVLYWIQPATVFAIYYHFFHGYDGLVAAHSCDPEFVVSLPGLPPFKIRELPSFLTITDPDCPFAVIRKLFKKHFDQLDREAESSSTARVLVNTFDELEPDALVSCEKIQLLPIGPVVAYSKLTDSGGGAELFEQDEKQYMEWLDTKPEKSVVYVSFGSFVATTKRQAEEILRGLRASGRPYLWVVRKDNRAELEAGGELELKEEGMVVEWCSQTRVLAHPAIGCFVTHCGWNSTLESLACGVPTVAVPRWADQPTNAKMMEVWGTGVRAEIGAEGVVEAAELSRCVEISMGNKEVMRKRVEALKDKAQRAVGDGGSSDGNLRAFVEEFASSKESNYRHVLKQIIEAYMGCVKL